MNNLNEYLSEHPEIAQEFLLHNQSLLEEIKNRFAEFHEENDLFARYLLAVALNTIVREEGNLSKEILKAELQKRDVVWIGEVAEC